MNLNQSLLHDVSTRTGLKNGQGSGMKKGKQNVYPDF